MAVRTTISALRRNTIPVIGGVIACTGALGIGLLVPALDGAVAGRAPQAAAVPAPPTPPAPSPAGPAPAPPASPPPVSASAPVGAGPFYTVTLQPDGSPTVARVGTAAADAVALTFDDGPDAQWTPKIIDVLRAHGVKATFFFVGNRIEWFPAAAKAVVDDGHALGNHTMTHPVLRQAGSARMAEEIEQAQKAIAGLTGRRPRFFRPPYAARPFPQADDQMLPSVVASERGLVCAGADVDPRDFDRPGAEVLAERILTACAGPGPHVVLLHDAGGDRAQTVEALAQVIPALKARGKRFVTLEQMLGGDGAPAGGEQPAASPPAR